MSGEGVKSRYVQQYLIDVGGTGKFATLRGHLSDTVEFDTDPKSGYSRSASRGECWFLE